MAKQLKQKVFEMIYREESITVEELNQTNLLTRSYSQKFLKRETEAGNLRRFKNSAKFSYELTELGKQALKSMQITSNKVIRNSFIEKVKSSSENIELKIYTKTKHKKTQAELFEFIECMVIDEMTNQVHFLLIQDNNNFEEHINKFEELLKDYEDIDYKLYGHISDSKFRSLLVKKHIHRIFITKS